MVDIELRTIGESLIRKRKEKGWSQAQLAKQCAGGVTQKTISNIETGENGPTLMTAAAIADALEWSLDDWVYMDSRAISELSPLEVATHLAERVRRMENEIRVLRKHR